jgi:hypothetical protein
LFLFVKQTNPNQTGGQWYNDASPFSIPCSSLFLCSDSDENFDSETWLEVVLGHAGTFDRIIFSANAFFRTRTGDDDVGRKSDLPVAIGTTKPL